MKKINTEDFDQTGKYKIKPAVVNLDGISPLMPRVKPKLDTERMLKELQTPQVNELVELPHSKTTPEPRVVTPGADNTPTPDNPPLEEKYPLKSKRVKLQMPFNFWEDQIIKMREIRDRKIAKNEYFSMAEVVRNALDDYLKKNY